MSCRSMGAHAGAVDDPGMIDWLHEWARSRGWIDADHADLAAGGFEVSVEGRTIEEDAWRLRKAASLVKLLALPPTHHFHREQVMDALWPDLGTSRASKCLPHSRSRVLMRFASRSTLPAGAVERNVAKPKGGCYFGEKPFHALR